ncbi:unnamed protein product [Linum trigynum]|uniref:DUF4378 domain-containing protein n=1 Tax=Linum trigynum TaxID=586398 RepID=A0AAV2DPP8_9ROSI
MPGEKLQMAPPSSLNLKPLLKKEIPLMLRDYLRDDFSSCSSNGFKSFPRRQCCPTTTVRLLLEFDLQKPISKPNHHSKPKPPLFHQKNRRSTATTTVSAFHRASEAVLRAVKSLPFHPSSSAAAAVSASVSRKKSLRIPRSLSRRLLRKSFFWRKVDSSSINVDNAGREAAVRESVRWRSFREFLEEQDHAEPPSEQVSHAGAASPAAVVGRISTSSSSNSRSRSGSEFTADSGGSESYSGSNNDSGKNDLPSPGGDMVSEGLAVTAGEESTAACATEIAKAWTNEEKEQFSPVSVLDCPFNDDEEDEAEVNSPFHRQTLVRVEGNNKVMKKTRRFDCLAQLQPLDLQKRITTVITEDSSSSSSENESSSSSTPDQLPPVLYSRPCTSGEQVEEETVMITTKAPHELLSIVKERASKSTNYGLISKAELLLLDYFEEKSSSSTEEDLEAVEEWVNGEPKEMFAGWEVKEGRSLYLKRMEEVDGEWRNVGEGKEEVGFELEHEIFTTLINEVLEL